MTEKQFQAILSPIYRLEAVAEERTQQMTSIEMLTVDVKSLQKETVDELKKQTTILGDIKSIMKDQVKSNSEGGKQADDLDQAARFKPLSVKDTGLAAFMMVSLSAALVASAGLFSLIPKVSLAQLGTAVVVGATMALLAPGFIKIVETLGKLKGETSVSYEGIEASKADPTFIFASAGAALLSMLGMVAALTFSSWIMQLIMPVSPIQLLTAVLMAAALLVMAPTFVKIAETLGKMKGNDTIDAGELGSISAVNTNGIWHLMGATMLSIIGLAVGIVIASLIFQLIMPVSAEKLITAFLVGIALTGAAWAYAQVLEKIEGKSFKDVLLASAAIPLIAAGIVLSSFILQGVVPIKDPYVYATVFLIGLSLVAAAYSFKLVLDSIKGAKLQEVAMAAAALVFIAGSIWATAWIFTQLPDTFNAPDWKWSLLSGLALLVFALPFAGLARAVRGLTWKDMGMAAAAAGFIALGIIATAFIFDIYAKMGGGYGPAPDPIWTLKTGLALIVFGVSMTLLGVITKTVGMKTLAMGVLAAIIISVGVLAVAWILSILPPAGETLPIDWVLGSALAIGLFGVIIGILGLIPLPVMLLGTVGMIIIAAGIWVVANIFASLPDISSTAEMLSDALLAPVNGIVDILARLKNEIGVDNLLPLAGGIIAISVSLLALAGAVAGVAAGGLFSSIANVGKAFFDGVASLFGGEKSKGPIDILQDIVAMAPEIAKVAKPIRILGDAFSFLQGGQNMEVLNRFFELMQLDPKASNIKAVQDMAPPIRDMVSALSGLDPDAPKKLEALFANVSWSSIFTPVASVASSMSILALNANLAGDGVTKVAAGMEKMVTSLNSLKKEYIDAIIKLFNDVNWSPLVDPIGSISTSIYKMSINADKLGVGMKMSADALVLMSAISVEILKEIAAVFDSLSQSDLTKQGEAMLLSIAPAISSISTNMVLMRSDAFIRMFEVMASSSKSIVAMSRPMTNIASALDKMGGVNIDGIEWAHKMARQLARSSFDSQASALEKIAKSYADISNSSNTMDVEAINATTDMFKALAYLYQNGRRNAMEELGEKLTEAIKELARMIADFEGTVSEQAEGSKNTSEAMAKVIDGLSSKLGISSGNAGSSSGFNEGAAAMQELVDLLVSGQAKITITDLDPVAQSKLA